MTAAFWSSLFSLRDAVDLAGMATARRLTDVRQSEERGTPVNGVILSHLHIQVRQLLEAWAGSGLAPAFASFGIDSDAGRCLRLVSFWLNERVCSHLDPDDRGDFAPVGPADVNLHAGGVLFFEEVERLVLQRFDGSLGSSVSKQGSMALSSDVALFILEQGFAGVHTGEVAWLEALKGRLRHGNLPTVVEPVVEEPTPPAENHPRVVALGLAVLGFYACCAWLSHGVGGL